MTARINEFKEDMKQFDRKLGIIQEGMSNGIYAAVKKANNSIQKALEKSM